MKFLKTVSVICLTLLLTLASACFGNQNPVNTKLFAGAYWLKSSEAGGIESVNETCVYSVKFQPIAPEDENALILTVDNDFVGTFTTVLTNSSYEGTPCYKFSTTLEVKGTYYYGTTSQAIDDRSSSEVYFLGLSDKLTPLYSKKYLLSTIPIISPLNNNSAFAIMEYSTETKYDREKNTATVTVKGGDRSSESYKIDDSERTYEGYAKSGSYLDNESLIFAFRSADLGENGFSANFSTLDALAQKVQSMNLSSEEAITGEIETQYTQAGVSNVVKFPVYNLQLKISGTFSGSAIKLAYAVDTTTQRRKLIQMKTELAFGAGYMVYTLNQAIHS